MGYYLVLPFVVALIQDDQGRVLVGQLPVQGGKVYPGRWGFLGSGKVDPEDRSLEAAVIREVREETGCQVISSQYFGSFHHVGERIEPDCQSRIPSLGICFLVKIEGALHPSELENVQWLSVEAALEFNLTPWCEHFLRELSKEREYRQVLFSVI